MSESRQSDGEARGPLENVAKPGAADFEGRRQKQLIAAALFGKPRAPMMLQRYTVIRELGSGGMGTVYLAYDDQLDRRVAIKLLHGSSAGEVARSRLQREAQAMARLSHPNVVTVYEVGRFDAEIFVAMEYVKGRDLRSWLEHAPRSQAEILATFLGAGQGLAAAHEAGIVHRDFKPDNVLVGDDGRVSVADFGLAYGRGDSPTIDDDPELPVSASGSLRDALVTPLTKTGALLGTPAYMAPEQFAGRNGDALADQFSFCASLWEGLYGERPFRGETLDALARCVLTAQLTPPRETEVPAWLEQVLRRGLARDPAARWPDMRTLLAVLADDPIARRRRRLRLALILAVLAVVLGGLTWLTVTQLALNRRQRSQNAVIEQVLDIERARGLAQAEADAQQARDATKMSVYRSYRAKLGAIERADPTLAAVLLREVGSDGREHEAWISAANLSLGRPLSRAIFRGQRDTIFALAFSPDERALYSGSADGEVWRWELASGAGRRLYAHQAVVSALLVLPDGRLISAAEDGTVRISGPGEGEPATLIEHGHGITAASLSHDGRTLAAAARDGSVWLIELGSGRKRALAGHEQAVHALGFDRADARLISASSDRTARVWSVADARPLATLVGHRQPVYFAGWLGDGGLVSGSDDGSARVWALLDDGPELELIVDHGAAITALAVDRERFASAALDGSVRITERPRGGVWAEAAPRELAGEGEGVWALAFTPDGARLISASFDGTATLLASDGQTPPRVLTGHREALLRARVSGSGRWLATGSWDTDVRLWDLDRPPLEQPLAGHVGAIQSVEISGDGARILTASSDASARIWSASDGSQLARLDGERPLDVAIFSPDGARVATGQSDGRVRVWEPASGRSWELGAHARVVRDLAFSPDGARLASASSDGLVGLWSVAEPEQAQPITWLRGHAKAVFVVGFDPSGARLVSAGADASVRVWSAETGALEQTLVGHRGPVRALAFDPRGDRIATASDDHDARLWPLTGGASLVLRGHTKKLSSIAFDPRGARVLTASADGSARVWDAHDGTPLIVLEGHAEALWGAAFLPDDRVVTHADDNTVRIWTLADQRSIELSGHAQAVVELAASPDGRWLVSAARDGDARIWRLDLLERSPERLVERLYAETLACLPIEQRLRELGEQPGEAERAFAACERRFGR